MIGRPPSSTLFPYTTLCRSKSTRARIAVGCCASLLRRSPYEPQAIHAPPFPCDDRRRVRGGDRRALRAHVARRRQAVGRIRSEEHMSELQSPCNLVCRLLLV